MSKYIFALDIGTRTIVGLLCRAIEGKVVVEHYQVESHPQRAMLDGQIHDVGQVSAVLSRIRESMEEKAGCQLKGAAIAAAGRALTTRRSETQLIFSATQEISQKDVARLEVQAVAQAREEMGQEKDSLYCVGFSPMRYKVNDMDITNPVGQRGKSIGVEIIATFLPQEVIDSLFSAMGKAGLEVETLTLEPIAAMAVAVPPELRMLNLALVDIGAGTSDIAVSREGTIVAYDMVDMAGDEITEAIAQHYLLDFNTAEAVKVDLGRHEQVEFTDVLGNKCREARETVLGIIEPVVDKLALALAEAVKVSNGGTAPAALFCTGGGSLTPLLQDYLALHLDLPPQRIGLRQREDLGAVNFAGQGLTGPEAVTPLGIAMMALRPRGEHLVQVWLNGQGVNLVNVQQATVAQALIHGGMDAQEAQGVLTFELNGVSQQVAGEAGEPISILVNDVAATLDTELVSGDRVQVQLGNGKLPEVKLRDLAQEQQPAQFVINGSPLELPPMYKINGLPAEGDTPVSPGDKVEVRPPTKVEELAVLLDLDMNNVVLEVDGSQADGTTSITPDSRIQVKGVESPPSDQMAVAINGRRLTMPQGSSLSQALEEIGVQDPGKEDFLEITVNGQRVDKASSLSHGDRIEVFRAAGSESHR